MLKKIKLEINNQNGDIIEQEEIYISDGDKIVMQAKEDMPKDILKLIHDSVKNALIDENVDVVTVAKSFEFKILKVN